MCSCTFKGYLVGVSWMSSTPTIRPMTYGHLLPVFLRPPWEGVALYVSANARNGTFTGLSEYSGKLLNSSIHIWEVSTQPNNRCKFYIALFLVDVIKKMASVNFISNDMLMTLIYYLAIKFTLNFCLITSTSNIAI